MKDPEPFFIVFCCKPPTTHTSKLVHGLRLWRSIVRSMVLSITIIGNFHHQKKLEIFSFRPRVLQHSFWDTQCTEDDCRYISFGRSLIFFHCRTLGVHPVASQISKGCNQKSSTNPQLPKLLDALCLEENWPHSRWDGRVQKLHRQPQQLGKC